MLQFCQMVKSSQPDLVSKLEQMRVLDSNPHKPVVRMAHLCVVSSHTVGSTTQSSPSQFAYLSVNCGSILDILCHVIEPSCVEMSY